MSVLADLAARTRAGLGQLEREVAGLQGLQAEVSTRLEALDSCALPSAARGLERSRSGASLPSRRPSCAAGVEGCRRPTTPVGVRHRLPGPPASERDVADRLLQELRQATQRCHLAMDRSAALLTGFDNLTREGPLCEALQEACRPQHGAFVNRVAILCEQLQDCAEANHGLCHDLCNLSVRAWRCTRIAPGSGAEDATLRLKGRLCASSAASTSSLGLASGQEHQLGSHDENPGFSLPLAQPPCRHLERGNLQAASTPALSEQPAAKTHDAAHGQPAFEPLPARRPLVQRQAPAEAAPAPLEHAALGHRCLAAELGRMCSEKPCRRCDLPGGWWHPELIQASAKQASGTWHKPPRDLSSSPKVASKAGA